MFGLFSKDRVNKWEIELIRLIVGKILPNRRDLVQQINEGLLSKRFPNSTKRFPNKIGFRFDPRISQKYEKALEGDFSIQGVRVFDRNAGRKIEVWVLVYRGLVSGYCLPEGSNVNLDLDQIDVDNALIRYLNQEDTGKISNILGADELAMINPSEVHELIFGGESYFHIADLENGDFLAVNMQRECFKFTHDPFEVVRIDSPIAQVLRDHLDQ
jgi:hypothetical protein